MEERKNKKWTEEIERFIRAECPLDFGGKEPLTQIINNIWGINTTKNGLTTFCCDKKIQLGIKPWQYDTGRFRGREPKPLLSEHEKKGYLFVKIAPRTWIQKSRYVYQLNHPEYKYKKGDVIFFLDGNNCNFNPDNLFLITMKELGPINAYGGIVKGNPELTKLKIIQLRLRMAMLDRAKEMGLTSKCGRGRVLKTEANEKMREWYKNRTEEQKERQRATNRRYLARKRLDPAWREKRRKYSTEWSRKSRESKKNVRND